MIELPVDLPAELVPLSWLLGVWEGSGVIDYQAEIGQLVALMRQLVNGQLIVHLEAPADVMSQRARGAGREGAAAAALRLRSAYDKTRYANHALRLDSSAQPVDALAREVRARLEGRT